MASYRVVVGKRKYEVIVEKNNLFVDGRKHQYDLESINGNGLHVLRQPMKNLDTYLVHQNRGLYQVQIDGEDLEAEVELGFRPEGASGEKLPGTISAPMPGVIVECLVRTGDTVSKDETLLIQEAMKMQMNIRTPAAGIVREVNIAPGQQVEKGFILIQIQTD
jgi:biotin carboxyl carrier protein